MNEDQTSNKEQQNKSPGDIKLGLESVKAFSGKATGALVGFAGTVIFANLFEPGVLGGFYFLYTLVFLTDRPVRGFIDAGKKRYSEVNSAKSEIVSSSFVVLIAVFILVAIVAYTLRGLLHAKTGVPGAAVVFLSMFLGINTFLLFQQLLGGEGWIGQQIWLDTLQTVIGFALQVTFVFAGLGTAGMGYGLAVAWFLTAPIGIYLLPIQLSPPSLETIRSLWEYARYSTFVVFVGKAYDSFDVFLLGALVGTSAVGYYGVAAKLTIPATFLSGVIASAIMPLVSNRHSEGKSISTELNNGTAYASSIAIPMLFGAMALPNALVVTAYGPAYAPAADLLIGLAIYRVIQSQTELYQQVLAGLDRPDIRLRVNAVTLVLNVLLGIVLVVGFIELRAFGVVVATVIAESFRYVLSVREVKTRVPEIAIISRSFVEQVGASVVMFTVVLALKTQIPVRSFIELTFLIGSGIIVYGTTVLIISEDFRFTVRSILSDVVS